MTHSDQASRTFELSREDAATMAELHARTFSVPNAWDAAAFEDLFTQDSVRAFGIKSGQTLSTFVLVQLAADQAEIITIATVPARQRQGLAARLIVDTEASLVEQGYKTWLLDVAQDNAVAISFYQKIGFAADGRRPDYYKRPGGNRIDAVLMSKPMARQAAT